MTRSKILTMAVLAVAAALGAAPPAHARPLSEMVRSGTFNLCADPDDLPYSARDGARPGLFVDMGERIAKALGIRLSVTWLPSREHLRKTNCDALPAVAVSPQEPRRNATRPYMHVHSVLVVGRDHPPVNGLADLGGGHVAVPSGSWAHHLLNEAGIPVWVRFLDAQAMLTAVAQGQADGTIVPQPAVDWLLHMAPDTPLRVAEAVSLDPSLDYDVAFALRHSDEAAVRSVDLAIGNMIADGSLRALAESYGIHYLAP